MIILNLRKLIKLIKLIEVSNDSLPNLQSIKSILKRIIMRVIHITIVNLGKIPCSCCTVEDTLTNKTIKPPIKIIIKT
jgi:hypothetical protein